MLDRTGSASLDVIIPVYNEELAVGRLVTCLGETFSTDAAKSNGLGTVRFLFVDDGSTDSTAILLKEVISGGFPAVLVRLARNFGHQNALAAGLDACDADVVGILDADLQDPPQVLLQMLARWRQGAAVVYGVRRRRKEALWKRAAYWSFYRLVAFLSEIRIPLDSGDFCLMDRQVVGAMRQLPERLRFIRGLRAWVGFEQVGVEYERSPRVAGTPKYTFRKLYRLATDGIIAASIRPLQVAQVVSFVFGMQSLILIGVAFVAWVRDCPLGVSPFLMLIGILLVTGNALLALCLYILAAYIGRTYLEVKGRPPYIVSQVITPGQKTTEIGGDRYVR